MMLSLALVVKRISRQSSELLFQVRILAGAPMFMCGQGESNSRLVLGKDALYHLTMPANA